MKKKYKGIDLFCGIGGFRLAMKENKNVLLLLLRQSYDTKTNYQLR